MATLSAALKSVDYDVSLEPITVTLPGSKEATPMTKPAFNFFRLGVFIIVGCLIYSVLKLRP